MSRGTQATRRARGRAKPRLQGWQTVDSRDADGAVSSAQRALATRQLVEESADGARQLGRGYWLEVRRASVGLVRCRERDGGAELRLLGLRPALLTFAPVELTVDHGAIGCLYRIEGGLLARRPGGSLHLAQRRGEPTELNVAVEGFFPRLRLLYGLERRFHVSVSRRFLARLVAEGQP